MRTFGTLEYVGQEWVIEAEPHVIIRLKRMFPRAKDNACTIRMRHAPDVAHDVAWVLERYPLDASDATLSFLRAQSSMHVENTERFVKVLSGALAPREFAMAIQPREYQRIGADLLLQQRGLLIADDLGVGKTCTAICALTDPQTRPALVVTMTHLTHQWAKEIARFAPKLTTHIIKKGKPYPLPHAEVLIVNYHKLAGWAPALAGKMNTVIFDEAQELRRNESAKAEAARAIAHPATFRAALTATPIYNYGNEFWNVLDVIVPDKLGTLEEFKREWCGATDANGNASIDNPKAFGAYLREQTLMIRRTRADVGRELPGISIVPHTVPSDDVLAGMGGKAEELARFILEREGKGVEQLQARGELDWRLRQATGIAKAKYVAEFTRMILESEERVVLFGWHHAVYDIWEEQLKNVGVARYTGEESVAAKEKAIQRFASGEARVLIMSLRSGAGLDGLQYLCRTVIFGELDWSPAVHEQCGGRVDRDEQPDPVMAYYLVSNEGSDPVIEGVLGLKRGQVDGVRNPHAEERDIAETVKTNGITELARAVLAKCGGAPVSVVDRPAKPPKPKTPKRGQLGLGGVG